LEEYNANSDLLTLGFVKLHDLFWFLLKIREEQIQQISNRQQKSEKLLCQELTTKN
jgi:hypothetical protein